MSISTIHDETRISSVVNEEMLISNKYYVYYVHLHNWLCSYPRNKIMIINSEQFFASPQVVINEVLQFLSLNPMNLNDTTTVVHNKGVYSSVARHKLDSYEKNKLSKLYQPLNQALINLLGWNELQWA